jgi:catechol 2,3-dioxygenase-like lactoylglutathione lyase family enzyme
MSLSASRILSIDHIQLAMPAGQEQIAERFYAEVLGFTPREKPAYLRGRGGCWFRAGEVDLHLGVDPVFHPATKAHPAFLTASLANIAASLHAAGFAVVEDTQLSGFQRFYCADPFGNRLEFLERTDPSRRRSSDD